MENLFESEISIPPPPEIGSETDEEFSVPPPPEDENEG
jgi:hypothetical protein